MWQRLMRASAGCGLAVCLVAGAQEERHGRKYKPLPPTAVVTVSVSKAFNGKPLADAAVVFQAEREGKKGAMEVKTDPEGRASIDILEVGSHIRLQVFSPGYASYATEFDVTSADQKDLVVKLERPRAQVSAYGEQGDKPAEVKPGMQMKTQSAPAATTPPPAATAATPATTPPGI